MPRPTTKDARAYYNEHDPTAAEWLRELIAAGMIAPGDVDERDIRDVAPADVMGYTQCHFFAGIGGWSRALRLAGWPDERPAWTGSCPCQPFSQAGAGGGFDDPRHLWPDWFWLIRICHPEFIFGEQVSGKRALPWIDLVSSHLENDDYTVGAIDSCAAGYGCPQLRHRLLWVAHSQRDDGRPIRRWARGEGSTGGAIVAGSREIGGMAHTEDANGRRGIGIAETGVGAYEVRRVRPPSDREIGRMVGGFWQRSEWIECRDGYIRPIEPGVAPLVNGLPGRMGLVRGYGNAIVPEPAAAFIRAVDEWLMTTRP